MKLMHWDVNCEAICSRIRAHKTCLKICLKTRNDPTLLERWINHHGSIVGLSSLIIADNDSDDPIVLETYRKYIDLIQIFQFKGPHDNPQHKRSLWLEFWFALSESCDYFLFLDTDEYLVEMNQNMWSASPKIVSRLHAQPERAMIPTYLLNNSMFYRDDVFKIDRISLLSSLCWGKPICPSPLENTHGFIHNNQVLGQEWSASAPSNLFLLHYNQLYPEQRLNAILLSMKNFGDIKEGEGLEALIPSLCEHHSSPRVRRYANEVKKINAAMHKSKTGQEQSRNGGLPEGSIQLDKNGKVRYASANERSILSSFIEYPNEGFRIGIVILSLCSYVRCHRLDSALNMFYRVKDGVFNDNALGGNSGWIRESIAIAIRQGLPPQQELQIVSILLSLIHDTSFKVECYRDIVNHHQARGQDAKAAFWKKMTAIEISYMTLKHN
jgi:hypothetical protein